ncbi:hypothetical protein P9738_09680 [Bacillus siamensis]|uniref:hypothetical protein n=1 Tax=Bacillus siamensis TaxID=659243 RepID=UPI0028FFEC52|nr:hypothetical protein [Bacillus siamensis]MDU0813236.1 hypothetical protein [Bacillus siamensis]MED5048079.1 hypothetical protein [Bacillus siamensis]MED5096499.1 hypothetical protein [Bacillus siamensis]
MRQLNKKMCGGCIQYPEKFLQFGEGHFLRALSVRCDVIREKAIRERVAFLFWNEL